jgi:hypothetical protein
MSGWRSRKVVLGGPLCVVEQLDVGAAVEGSSKS